MTRVQDRPGALPEGATIEPGRGDRDDLHTNIELDNVLSGIQNADEGGVEDAEVVGRERPAGGVPAGRWSVRCRRLWARCRGC